MNSPNRIQVATSYELAGAPELLEQFVGDVRTYIAQADPSGTVKFAASKRLIEVSARLMIPNDGSQHYESQIPMRLLGSLQGRARALGITITPKSERRTTYRLQAWVGRIRVTDGLNFVRVDGPERRRLPGVEQFIYPGVEMPSRMRRAQIWLADEETQENLGLGAFAGFDAYLVELEFEGDTDTVPIWIDAGSCEEIPQMDVRVLSGR